MKNGIDWESLGFSVVGTAQNGKEALELIEEYHPDLLISDIKMPFMDGLELSKTIHENYINTKIILFSGWDDFEYARTAISYGVLFEKSREACRNQKERINFCTVNILGKRG